MDTPGGQTSQKNEDCLEMIDFLTNFGSMKNPGQREVELAVELRALSHEALGRMVHTQIRRFIERYGTEKDLQTAQAISRRIQPQRRRRALGIWT